MLVRIRKESLHNNLLCLLSPDESYLPSEGKGGGGEPSKSPFSL